MNKEMEDFFDELEALVDSGGGQIYIGNKMQDVNDIEAEAALLYLSMLEVPGIKKAMKDVSYFWDVVEMGMEEMGLEQKSAKVEEKKRISQYARVLENLPPMKK
tara:strand:+ start:772 stop:1083 length:312 start_codon:yes stop_codon:yes gene_type:complete